MSDDSIDVEVTQVNQLTAVRYTMPWPLRIGVAGASVVIIVAGLKAVAPIISSFLFAMLLALMLSPVARRLMKWRVPRPLAIALTLLFVFVGGAAIILMVLGSASELAGNLPEYNQRFLALREQLFTVLAGMGMDTSRFLRIEDLNPQSMVRPAASILGTVFRDIGHSFFVLLLTAFMLVEMVSSFEKVDAARAAGERTPAVRFGELGHAIQKYVGISAFMGLLGSICYFILLKTFGVAYVATWVMLFFVLSFVPSVGGILAVLPALLLVLLEQGLQRTLVFAAIFIGFSMLLGDVVKPRLMQRGFEISIVGVFFSLVFWNFVLGPVGIVLAVPLTITIRRLIQEDSPDVRKALVG